MPNKNYGCQSYLLALLWLMGLLKDFLNAYFFELDWTGLMVGVVTLDIVFNILFKGISFKKKYLNILLLLVIFYLWIIISLAYSPSLDYKYEKAFKFIGNIVFFIYPLTIKKIDFEKIIRVYLIMLLPVAIYYVYNLSFGALGNSLVFNEDLKNNYLQVAMHLGILILMLEFFSCYKWLKYLSILLILASSARGPVIFLIITLLIYWISKFKISRISPKFIFYAGFVISVLTGLFFYFKSTILNLMVSSETRFTSLLGGEDNSLLTRIDMYNFGFFQPFEKFSTIFFGNGIGSFGILYSGDDGRAYPHNIFLEIFFELGMLGLLIIAILLLNVFSKLSLKKNIFSLLFVFLFFNVMKSSSLIDLWLFFGVMVGVIFFRNDKNDKYLTIIN